jgi:hypothetical protein
VQPAGSRNLETWFSENQIEKKACKRRGLREAGTSSTSVEPRTCIRMLAARCLTSVSERAPKDFKLESLILAQNERWRHA